MLAARHLLRLPPPRRRPSAGRRAAAMAVAAAAIALSACGDDGSDAERFCGEINADVAAVVDPPLSTADELAATLEHYRKLGRLAPVAVDDEWEMLVINLETVSTVVPDDEASVQRAVTQAYASERSAVAVRDWLLANCGVDLGPVATIAQHGPVSPVLPTTEPATPESTGG